jgi:hypothetical protein
MSPEAETSIAVAIDPIALILSTKWYLIYLEIHHPREPATDALAKVFGQMSPVERNAAVQRAKTLESYCQATHEAASTVAY